MGESAVTVQVVGRVQGVGFRWMCQQQAERLEVRGWVRNEPDGSVAGRFEGAREAVDQLVDWCRSGPPGSHVERVDVETVEPSGARGMQIRF